MEYLSRILDHVTTTMSFKFHPLCGSLQLSHLLFADDLLLFSKGDTHSIMILLRAFATFSFATGLQINSMKSNIYFNGVHHSVKADIIEVSGFVEGTLPFKYLGVPIVSGRLSHNHCAVLIDKVTARIRGFGSRKLSYSGRLTLVNAVLTSLYSYWAKIFLIPKVVLRRIDTLCRKYLWDSSTEFLRSPPAKFPLAFTTGLWNTSPPGYYVSSGYDLIWTHYPRVPWYKYTWNVWSVPKNTFINWLIVIEGLRLKDKLFQLGISQDAMCLVCGMADETHLHLFHQCQFIRRILGLVSVKLNIRFPLTGTLAWVYSKPWSKIKKKVLISWI
ncbi:uncharacterized protein LOC141651500 [Silene latifolia]|uniref:uncharacterized protein LOC141651500 n=1 Tax=Silene latifolia TaxID=37657 RepID=UPI003D78933B